MEIKSLKKFPRFIVTTVKETNYLKQGKYYSNGCWMIHEDFADCGPSIKALEDGFYFDGQRQDGFLVKNLIDSKEAALKNDLFEINKTRFILDSKGLDGDLMRIFINKEEGLKAFISEKFVDGFNDLSFHKILHPIDGECIFLKDPNADSEKKEIVGFLMSMRSDEECEVLVNYLF